MRAGSRIETMPRPIPWARAVSHSVWIAIAVLCSSAEGMVCRPRPRPLARPVSVNTASCTGAPISPPIQTTGCPMRACSRSGQPAAARLEADGVKRRVSLPERRRRVAEPRLAGRRPMAPDARITGRTAARPRFGDRAGRPVGLRRPPVAQVASAPREGRRAGQAARIVGVGHARNLKSGRPLARYRHAARAASPCKAPGGAINP